MAKRNRSLDERVNDIETILLMGREDSFILAWGRSLAWLAEKKLVLILLTIAVAILSGGLVFVALRAEKRQHVVIAVDERTGKAIPVDPAQYFKGDDGSRSVMELQGFAIDWVRGAFAYNFLNNKGSWVRAMAFVDTGAQGAARYALRPTERKELTDRGFDVRLVEDGKGDGLGATLDAQEPAVVSVVLRRVATSASGQEQPLPVLRVRLELQVVPRSVANPHGLVITDISSAQS